MKGMTSILLRLLNAKLRITSTQFGPFSIDIVAGERIAILGPSGAGKSTLLRLISGESVIESGGILLNGKSISTFKIDSLSHQLAVLPQSYPNTFDLPVDLVIELGRLNRDDSVSLDDIVKQAATLARADHLLTRTTGGLSGGELARVHLARVFAQFWDVQAGLLLVDEPLSAFDPGLQYELFQRLSSFARSRGHALVAVLHDVQLALHGFDRLLMIHQGQLFADCPVSLAALPKLEKLFGVRFLTHQSDEGLFLRTADFSEFS